MTQPNDSVDDVIETLATLSNRLRAYGLYHAAEAIDDAMVTAFGALRNDFESIENNSHSREQNDVHLNLTTLFKTIH